MKPTEIDSELIHAIEHSTPHAIVQLMYYCQRKKDYSPETQIKFLKTRLTYTGKS